MFLFRASHSLFSTKVQVSMLRNIIPCVCAPENCFPPWPPPQNWNSDTLRDHFQLCLHSLPRNLRGSIFRNELFVFVSPVLHTWNTCGAVLYRAIFSFPNIALDTTKTWFRTRAYSIALAERDGTRAEIRFRISPKWTSPFKSVGASVQSTAGSRGVRISLSNAG